MHANFASTHDSIMNEIVYTGIAEELVELEYADKSRKTANKEDSFRYKITHKITYPDYCLVADELSSNISQKKDGYIRGAKMLCKKASVLKKVSSN